MKFRSAATSDLAPVAELMKATQDAHVEAYPWRYRSISKQAIEDLLRADLESEARFVVAVDGDEDVDGNDTVLGYTLVDFLTASQTPVLQPRRFAYLRQIGVASEARGRGIGSALIEDVRQACRAEKITDLELDVWAFNAGALRFFGEVGFEQAAARMRLSV